MERKRRKRGERKRGEGEERERRKKERGKRDNYYLARYLYMMWYCEFFEYVNKITCNIGKNTLIHYYNEKDLKTSRLTYVVQSSNTSFCMHDIVNHREQTISFI